MIVKMKRILATAIALIVLALPATAYANHAIRVDAKGDFLICRLDANVDQAKIGDEITLFVTIRNISAHDFGLSSIYSSFDEDSYADPFEQSRIDIPAGKTVTFEMKETIPNYVSWYKEGEEFFTDISVYPIFYWDSPDGKARGTDHMETGEGYYISNAAPVTLKLSNIQDGTGFISLNVKDTEPEMAFFPCEPKPIQMGTNNDAFKHYEIGENQSEIFISNISDRKLENLYIAGTYADTIILKLMPDMSVTKEQTNYATIRTSKERPDSSLVRYRVLFEVEGDFYGVQLERKYRNIFLEWSQCFDMDIQELGGEYGGTDTYKVVVTNTFTDSLENFYVDFVEDEEQAFDFKQANFVRHVNPDEPMIFYTTKPQRIRFGYVANGVFYVYWEYVNDTTLTEQERYTFVDGRDCFRIDAKSDDAADDNPNPSSQPETDTEQNESEKTVPADANANTDEKYVTDIKVKSSVPLWVYPTFGVVSAAVVILVIVLRKKSE